MDRLSLLLELSYSSTSFCILDMMHLGFQREVQKERSWFSFLHGWCVHVADRLMYLDAIFQELACCSGHISIAQSVIQLRSGDNIVFADSITYFKGIRNFEAEKLANLHLFFRLLQCISVDVESLLLDLTLCSIYWIVELFG
ncbi:hypothetical protein CTI12_AA457120 [Artemisia annua]|uniref:Uncharacterized protein n=1 Tax=Artemisia annua TaxID=35608 RepID=A0A2U1LT72_ARTAN|nr:hypothetical protein CTI12_AA457120 [Artemisia annua]